MSDWSFAQVYWSVTLLVCVAFGFNIWRKVKKLKAIEKKQAEVRAAFAAHAAKLPPGPCTWLQWERGITKCRPFLAGLDSVGVVVGVDFCTSADVSGNKCFEGASLHQISDEITNPFEWAVRALVDVSAGAASLVSCVGFDCSVGGEGNEGPCKHIFRRMHPAQKDVQLAVDAYRKFAQETPRGALSSLAPLIAEGIRLAKTSRKFVVVVALLGGDIDKIGDSIEACVNATQYPMSVLVVGVGDGPFRSIERLQNAVLKCKLENLSFMHMGNLLAQRPVNCGDSAALEMLNVLSLAQAHNALATRIGMYKPGATFPFVVPL